MSWFSWGEDRKPVNYYDNKRDIDRQQSKSKEVLKELDDDTAHIVTDSDLTHSKRQGQLDRQNASNQSFKDNTEIARKKKELELVEINQKIVEAKKPKVIPVATDRVITPDKAQKEEHKDKHTDVSEVGSLGVGMDLKTLALIGLGAFLLGWI